MKPDIETNRQSAIAFYRTAYEGNPATDQIICDLRDSQGTVLQSSSIDGFSTGGGWKSFSFDKKVSPGTYIFTCYLFNSYTLEMHNYGIQGNSNDNSYLQGTRYYSIGGYPEDWSTWEPCPWDLKFKVMIATGKNPPDIPSKPSGTSSGQTGTSYAYSTSATDPDNDQIKYIFDWGDGNSITTYYVDSDLSASDSHSWTNPGSYIVKVKAVDDGGMESGWSEGLTVTITTPNVQPNTPSKPSGTSSGQIGTSYTYRASAIDPNNDQVRYTFDWGDGNSITTDYVDSGLSASASHSWTDPGSYIVKVTAVDDGGMESGWSEELTVTITTNPTESELDTPSLDADEREKEMVQIIGVILVIAGLVFIALTAVKKDVTIELGVSERTIKYVGGTGIVLIIIGVYMLLKSAGLI